MSESEGTDYSEASDSGSDVPAESHDTSNYNTALKASSSPDGGPTPPTSSSRSYVSPRHEPVQPPSLLLDNADTLDLNAGGAAMAATRESSTSTVTGTLEGEEDDNVPHFELDSFPVLPPLAPKQPEGGKIGQFKQPLKVDRNFVALMTELFPFSEPPPLDPEFTEGGDGATGDGDAAPSEQASDGGNESNDANLSPSSMPMGRGRSRSRSQSSGMPPPPPRPLNNSSLGDEDGGTAFPVETVVEVLDDDSWDADIAAYQSGGGRSRRSIRHVHFDIKQEVEKRRQRSKLEVSLEEKATAYRDLQRRKRSKCKMPRYFFGLAEYPDKRLRRPRTEWRPPLPFEPMSEDDIVWSLANPSESDDRKEGDGVQDGAESNADAADQKVDTTETHADEPEEPGDQGDVDENSEKEDQGDEEDGDDEGDEGYRKPFRRQSTLEALQSGVVTVDSFGFETLDFWELSESYEDDFVPDVDAYYGLNNDPDELNMFAPPKVVAAWGGRGRGRARSSGGIGCPPEKRRGNAGDDSSKSDDGVSVSDIFDGNGGGRRLRGGIGYKPSTDGESDKSEDKKSQDARRLSRELQSSAAMAAAAVARARASSRSEGDATFSEDVTPSERKVLLQFLRAAEQGVVMTKHQRFGFPHGKLVRCTRHGLLDWGTNRLPIQKAVEVKAVFLKKVDPRVAFSVVTPNRSVNLATNSEAKRDFWIQGLRLLRKHLRANFGVFCLQGLDRRDSVAFSGPSFPSTPNTSRSEYARWMQHARSGETLVKHGRKGRPHRKKIRMDFDKAVVSWGSGNMDMTQVLEVRRGVRFRTLKKKDDPDNCFSIIGFERQLDLQCGSPEACSFWVDNLKKYLKHVREGMVRSHVSADRDEQRNRATSGDAVELKLPAKVLEMTSPTSSDANPASSEQTPPADSGIESNAEGSEGDQAAASNNNDSEAESAMEDASGNVEESQSADAEGVGLRSSDDDDAKQSAAASTPAVADGDDGDVDEAHTEHKDAGVDQDNQCAKCEQYRLEIEEYKRTIGFLQAEVLRLKKK